MTWTEIIKEIEIKSGKACVCERLKVPFIQKHGRGLNRVPNRTCIIACLNQLRYRCHGRQRDREKESENPRKKEGDCWRKREL